MTRFIRPWAGLVLAGLLAAACTSTSDSASPSTAASPSPTASQEASPSPEKEAKGIFKLDHLIFVVQENRSFDHYFGTYPGANGIPKKVCVPHPALGDKCMEPYHDTDQKDVGGPHAKPQSDIDVNGGKMDGFIRAALLQATNVCAANPTDGSCKDRVGPQGQPEVMGYHTSDEIRNYWAYADQFVLHDRMFASVDSWTLPAHLFLVSGWSAYCKNHRKASTCTSDIYGVEKAKRDEVPYAWTDITYLLHKNDVSWAYYVAPGTCWTSDCAGTKEGTANAMNVLPGFQTVHQNDQIGNIQEHPEYFKAAEEGTLPSVSWVIPGRGFSEHPGNGEPITGGIAWVTKVVNAAMASPNWESTAIFVSWDDWGGFYDHVKPPRVDENGYGIRVPSFMISPYAKQGFIDSQVLSSDAYLKLIEDRFLDGQRLDPETDGRPDPRPTVREDVKILGNLIRDFNFKQDPRPPFFLDPYQKGAVPLREAPADTFDGIFNP